MISYKRPTVYRRRGRVEEKAGQVSVELRVGQNVRAPLERLVLMFGGSVKVVPSYGSKRRDGFCEWRLYGAQAIVALRKIRPYLMVKGAHVDLAIEYHERCFGVIGNFSDRIGFYERMQDLQHKGQHLVKAVSGDEPS